MATKVSIPEDASEAPRRPLKVQSTDRGHGLKVYWSDSKRAFIGKHFHAGGWRNKAVPVDIVDEHTARRWFEEWHAEFLKGNPQPQPRLRQTTRTLLPRWKEWQRELKADDRKVNDTDRVMRLHVFDSSFADVDVDTELKIGHCVDWVEHVQRKGLAPFTVRNIVQCLRSFLSDCRGKGWIELRENLFNDPFVKSKTKGAERVAGNETIIHLSAEQAVALVTCELPAIPDVRKANNVLAVCTGLRAAELQGLWWGDLHLAGELPYVDVQRQLVSPGSVGKAGALPIATFKPPKKKSYRQVPLHPFAVSAMKTWAERWAAWVGREPKATDPVFPNREGEFVTHAGAFRFRHDLAVAGVPTKFEGHDITFHATRRTFLTLLSDAGVSDSRVAALAGHGPKGVTHRNYIAKNLSVFYPEVLKLPFPKRTSR